MDTIGSVFLSIAIALFGALGTGCTTGSMRVDKTYYLGASNGTDRVYYRITVKGRTQLGDAEFREGWYPATAVDSLFGDISEEGAGNALATREELRNQIDQKLIETRAHYLEIAADTESTPEDVEKALRAVLRVRQSAKESLSDSDSAQIIEYNPQKDLVTARAGHKLVLLLASDPDQIISQLAEVAEDERTEQLVSQFAQVVAATTRTESARARAREEDQIGQRSQIARQLESFREGILEGATAADVDAAVLRGRLNALLSILEIDE